MNSRLALCAAIGIAVASLVSAPAAHAEDQRTCISKTEYFGGFDYGAAQGDLEARWEVQRLGWEEWTPLGYVTAYPRCGYSTDVTWYGVAYNRDGSSYARVWRPIRDVPLHGHERVR